MTCDLGYVWTDGEEEHLMECMDTGCWEMVESNATCQSKTHNMKGEIQCFLSEIQCVP